MSNQDKSRLQDQIHDMIEKEHLILSDEKETNNGQINKGPLIGKASQDEMFGDTRNKMHNYANEIIDNYQSDGSEASSNKKGSGLILKLILFALAVVALVIVYFMYQ
jgi:hypothetical protein